jgi:flagellar hook-associated protein 3 FlgL
MRISSLHIFNVARNGMADVNKELVRTQEQLSSGLRVLSPSDDPVASTKILQINDELASIDQYLKNIDIAKNNLTLEESALNNVVGVIQRMQEMAVAAGNTATLTQHEYRAMAKEVATRVDELMNLVNTKNANGDFIFGGYKSSEAPFVGDTFGGFEYLGDDGQQFMKVAHGTKIAASDSGKSAFLEIPSEHHNIETYASPTNSGDPAGKISIGQVINHEEFAEFYPNDMVITFNADSDIVPPGRNFTVTERDSGRVITANQAYFAGEEIRLNGVSFKMVGSPAAGSPSIPALLPFGVDTVPAFPVNFSGANSETLVINVGGRTERLVLDANITNQADLIANLTNVANGNANKLAILGISVDSQGFHMPQGINIQMTRGTANSAVVLGIDLVNGRTSTNGFLAVPGDRFFVDSSENQSILNTLARFKEGMESFDGSATGKSELSALVAETISNLAHGLNRVVDVQAKVGSRANTLETTKDLHLDTQIVNREVLGDIRDLDYAEASARLAQQSLILQAAQQSFIRVSQLSLFDRL